MTQVVTSNGEPINWGEVAVAGLVGVAAGPIAGKVGSVAGKGLGWAGSKVAPRVASQTARTVGKLVSNTTVTAIEGGTEQSVESMGLYAVNPGTQGFNGREMIRRGSIGFGAGATGNAVLKPLQTGRNGLMGLSRLQAIDANTSRTFSISSYSGRHLHGYTPRHRAPARIELSPVRFGNSAARVLLDGVKSASQNYATEYLTGGEDKAAVNAVAGGGKDLYKSAIPSHGAHVESTIPSRLLGSR